LTDYYRAEARRYLLDRANTEAETMRQSRGRGSKVETEARPREAEARPSQLKKAASRPPRAEADASRTTSLLGHHIQGQRSRSPRGCSGERENVLAVGNCCYVAVSSAAQDASAPTGKGRGYTMAAARLQLDRRCQVCHRAKGLGGTLDT